ncbi:hypothetical protein [Corynebacterium urealyticum]|uniref:hypothetical protein n=1 Tax=Corynebacterium urealyticum TaxID=43771 RepID=UPI00293E3E96|nr:hypothetical protein [Corynebacterium urealyticum]WOH93922.1 hypothetical protein RZ943_07530 [Corynebacterium urealyticum]
MAGRAEEVRGRHRQPHPGAGSAAPRARNARPGAAQSGLHAPDRRGEPLQPGRRAKPYRRARAVPVILQIDRALLRGHDLGAFRTGVSAEDVYILILGLSGFATLHRNTFYALYGMDVREPHNESGVTELACDAVVAFLTTPMRTRQDNSYTHSSPSEIVGESVAASLYDSEEFWQE